MICTILVNRKTLDVLHHEVGQSILRGPAIEQARDVRMIKPGQNLSFNAEVPQHRVGVHPRFDQLDRNLLLVLLVGALGQVHRPHPAAADFAKHAVWPD